MQSCNTKRKGVKSILTIETGMGKETTGGIGGPAFI
jgi:hypothetical protein